MAPTGLSQEVTSFIEAHIDSIEQLEVLLLLRRENGRSWSPEAVGRELRIAVESAAARLADLQLRGLLFAATDPPSEYRYQPEPPDRDRAVGALAAAYSERRVAVISFIFSRPLQKIRTFADAFDLRRQR